MDEQSLGLPKEITLWQDTGFIMGHIVYSRKNNRKNADKETKM